MRTRTRAGVIPWLFASALSVATSKPAGASPPSPGDFLVTDFEAGTGFLGAVLTVDPATGSRTILSDFSDPIQGPTGVDPFGLTLDASGIILVVDLTAGTGNLGALFTVDPVTGSRTILSDFGDATQGPTGFRPAGLTLDASGTILVIDRAAGTGNLGALFTVDPVTGSRTILSDFGDATQGPTGVDPAGLTLDASGTILVIDINAGTGNLGALFTVDPVTGSRTILSDFGDATQGPTGDAPAGLTRDASGIILVTDANAGSGLGGALFTVDPVSGSRSILSDFGDATQGPTGIDPIGLTLDASGAIWVIDHSAGTGLKGALFTVDPITGNRTILSDFGNPIDGPSGVDPVGIAVFSVESPPSDTTPPDTVITGAVDGKGKPVPPGGKTGSTSIMFTFSGSDDVGVSGFECSLDGATFSACSSPTSYVALKGGAHLFQVRAVDTSGNVDPTPAAFSWFVSGKRSK